MSQTSPEADEGRKSTGSPGSRVERIRFRLREFLQKTEPCILRAWFRFFDKHHKGNISHIDFVTAITKLAEEDIRVSPTDGLRQRLGYDAGYVFRFLDEDDSGVLMMEDIAPDESLIFHQFKTWCAKRYDSPETMIHELHKAYNRAKGQRRPSSDGEADVQTSPSSSSFRPSSSFQRKSNLVEGTSRAPQSARASFSAAHGPTPLTRHAMTHRSRLSMFIPQAPRKHHEESEFDDSVPLQTFTIALEKLGWESHAEGELQRELQMLFNAFDVDGTGTLGVKELKWLAEEAKRQKAKEAAKERHKFAQHKYSQARKDRAINLHLFKTFLRKSYRLMWHAWRKALDLDGSMTLQRAELFKVCRQLGWQGDARLLWQAMDFDNSGVTTLEELDPECAQKLALFRKWAADGLSLGPKPANGLWKRLDKKSRGRMTYDVFARECDGLGFPYSKAKELAGWLDWQQRKSVGLDEILFLDVWRPPEWLTATPNQEAADHLRRLMKERYGHHLRAWRQLMDKDNSNSCNWHEFTEACRILKLPQGDVPGAWLALDKDLSGQITLSEIDEASNAVLLEFKRWADEEFSSARACFKALDADTSHEVAFQEFRYGLRCYGFRGDVKSLFTSLDTGGKGRLQIHDIDFLDGWALPEDNDAMMAEDKAEEFLQNFNLTGHRRTLAPAIKRESANAHELSRPIKEDCLIRYETCNPGPGAYDLLSGFGALPRMPTARHTGAFSFALVSSRTSWISVCQKGRGGRGHELICPEPPRLRRPPQWSFGSCSRPARCPTCNGALAVEPLNEEKKCAVCHKKGTQFACRKEGCHYFVCKEHSRVEGQTKHVTPGPGSYELETRSSGPRFSMGNRRGVTLHPLQTSYGTPRERPRYKEPFDATW